MRFRVGPYIYKVELVHGYIEHEGERCLGLCDNETHVLQVSDVAAEAQQIQIICHEYMEAWIYHFGEHLANLPAKEAFCDLFGMAMAQCMMDFVAQFRGNLSKHPARNESPKDSRPQESDHQYCNEQDKNPEMPSISVERFYEPVEGRSDRRWAVQIFQLDDDQLPTQDEPYSLILG